LAIRERRGRDGRVSYQLVVYAGRDGRGRDEYVRRTLTGVSRRDASKAHAQLVMDVERRQTGPSRSLTVKELANQWWESAARDLSPSTRIGYRYWLDSRVLPQFGKKRISAVTTADVERWYGQLRDGSRPLGIRSIRGCRTVLSAMFTTAVRWGYLPSSPVERARLPKAPKWTPRAPEPEQVAARIAEAIGALVVLIWLKQAVPNGMINMTLDTRWMSWGILATVVSWLIITRNLRVQVAGVKHTSRLPVLAEIECERFPDQCPCTTELGKGLR